MITCDRSGLALTCSGLTSLVAGACPAIVWQGGNGYNRTRCFADLVGGQGRLLTTYFGTVDSPPDRSVLCEAQGFRFCGTEFGGECYGGGYQAYALVQDTGCTIPCNQGTQYTCKIIFIHKNRLDVC